MAIKRLISDSKKMQINVVKDLKDKNPADMKQADINRLVVAMAQVMGILKRTI